MGSQCHSFTDPWGSQAPPVGIYGHTTLMLEDKQGHVLPVVGWESIWEYGKH